MDARNVLKNVYLFRDASPEELAALAAIAEAKAYMVEEYLYHAGDAADALFVIDTGTVDVILKDKEIPLATVGSAQVLGELAFVDPSERLASAITREPTHLLRLPFAKLEQVFAAQPKLATAFYRQACVFLSRQLRQMAPDLNRRYL
jgi:CRP-like cAMP-binding protein